MPFGPERQQNPPRGAVITARQNAPAGGRKFRPQQSISGAEQKGRISGHTRAVFNLVAMGRHIQQQIAIMRPLGKVIDGQNPMRPAATRRCVSGIALIMIHHQQATAIRPARLHLHRLFLIRREINDIIKMASKVCRHGGIVR